MFEFAFCFLTFKYGGWHIFSCEGFLGAELPLLAPMVVAEVRPPLPISGVSFLQIYLCFFLLTFVYYGVHLQVMMSR